MKNVLWILNGLTVKFKVTWIEYIFLKRIFKQKRIKAIKEKKIRGRKIDVMMTDEFTEIDWGKITLK